MHTFTQDAPTKKETTPKPISKGDKTRQDKVVMTSR